MPVLTIVFYKKITFIKIYSRTYGHENSRSRRQYNTVYYPTVNPFQRPNFVEENLVILYLGRRKEVPQSFWIPVIMS